MPFPAFGVGSLAKATSQPSYPAIRGEGVESSFVCCRGQSPLLQAVDVAARSEGAKVVPKSIEIHQHRLQIQVVVVVALRGDVGTAFRFIQTDHWAEHPVVVDGPEGVQIDLRS